MKPRCLIYNEGIENYLNILTEKLHLVYIVLSNLIFTLDEVHLNFFRDFIFQKLNMKNFKIKTRIIKCFMEEEIPSARKRDELSMPN